MGRGRKRKGVPCPAQQKEMDDAFTAPIVTLWDHGFVHNNSDAWWFVVEKLLRPEKQRARVYCGEAPRSLVDWCKPRTGSMWRYHTKHKSQHLFHAAAIWHVRRLQAVMHLFRVDETADKRGLGIFLYGKTKLEDLVFPDINLSGFLAYVPKHLNQFVSTAPSIIRDPHNWGKFINADEMRAELKAKHGDKFDEDMVCPLFYLCHRSVNSTSNTNASATSSCKLRISHPRQCSALAMTDA